MSDALTPPVCIAKVRTSSLKQIKKQGIEQTNIMSMYKWDMSRFAVAALGARSSLIQEEKGAWKKSVSDPDFANQE